MKHRWVQLTAVGLIGVVIGLGLGVCGAARWVRHRWQPDHQQRMLERFSRALKLNPEQREAVGKILDERRRQMQALHAQVRPQFEAMRAETRQQISAVLSPEQAARYVELEAKWDKRREKFLDRKFGSSPP